jgi:hypothetical protein
MVPPVPNEYEMIITQVRIFVKFFLFFSETCLTNIKDCVIIENMMTLGGLACQAVLKEKLCRKSISVGVTFLGLTFQDQLFKNCKATKLTLQTMDLTFEQKSFFSLLKEGY